MMTNFELLKWVIRFCDPDDEVKWLAGRDLNDEASDSWNECESGKILAWIVEEAGGGRYTPRLRLLACNIVEKYALPHAGDAEGVAREKLEVARRHARGEATDAELGQAEADALRHEWATAELSKQYAVGAAWKCASRCCAWYAVTQSASSAGESHRDRVLAEIADMIRAEYSWEEVEAMIAKAEAEAALKEAG